MPSKINYGIDNLESWNPIKVRMPDGTLKGYHCTKISPGCLNCFAERMNLNRRFGWANLIPYDNRKVEFAIDERVLAKPLHWKKPRTIFVCDMMDMFHEGMKLDHVCQILNIIDNTKQHKYLILTKRIHRVKEPFWFWQIATGRSSLPDNLWLGVTVVNQQEADEKIIDVCNWISLEPLLGPIDLHLEKHPNIKWVIVGAESGPHNRYMELDWAISVVRQCRDADIPVFVKQIRLSRYFNAVSKNPDEWPESLRVRQTPFREDR